MSGRFAGSGSLDDRRRRRLVTRTDQGTNILESAGTSEAELHEVEEDQSFDPQCVMLRDLTPPDIWKSAALITAVVFLAVGAVVASHDPGLRAGQFGDVVARFFDLGHGRAIKFLSIATLISAAHMALVIRIARARSPRDFRGRFRIWRWAAGLFVGAAMLVGTDLHLVFSDLIHQWSGVSYEGWARLNWLVPFGMFAAVITWKLWIDMSLCRSSQLFLGLAVVSAGALMASDQITQATGYAHVALVAQLAVGVCLFAAMVLHMRFVSHVNPNPPEPKAVRENPNTRVEYEEESFSRPVAHTEPEEVEVPRKRTKRSGKRQKPVIRDASDYDEFEDEAPQPQRRRRTRTRREGPPADSLKGLTKKQRKLARKQHREEQRALENSHRE